MKRFAVVAGFLALSITAGVLFVPEQDSAPSTDVPNGKEHRVVISKADSDEFPATEGRPSNEDRFLFPTDQMYRLFDRP